MNESLTVNTISEESNPFNGSLIVELAKAENVSLPEVTASICHFNDVTENYIICAVFLSIFLLSVVGNLLVIVVITNQRSMRSITNLYLMNLAVSDLMLSVICMPPTLVSMVTSCWLFGNALCKIFAYLQPMVVTASAYTLAVIAFERYFAICRPLHSRIWQTRSHAYAMITVIWSIAIIANLLITFMYEEQTYLTPNGIGITCAPILAPIYHFAYQFYMTIVLCVIPLVVMTSLYGQVIRSLKTGIKAENAAENSEAGEKTSDSVEEMPTTVDRKWTKLQKLQQKLSINNYKTKETTHRKSEASMVENPLRSTHGAKSAEAKQRVIKMLIVVVVIFFCCWTPSYIWWLLVMAGDSFENLGLRVWNSDLNTIITLLTYLSSCTNPITYCFLNKKFRNAVYSMFGKKKILRHHFQKVYYPVTNTSHKVNDRPGPINRSISTTSNPLRQQAASEYGRICRSPSSQSSPNAALLRQNTIDVECL